MPTIISEGKGVRALTFEFSDKWQVYKYDEVNTENFYNKFKGNGYKAIDFIAKSDKSFLLIEVKYVLAEDERSSLRLKPEDLRYLAVLQELKSKLSEEELKLVSFKNKRPYLVDEIDKKVRDTLVGLFASYRHNDSKLSAYNRSLVLDNKPIFIIVFLERNQELNKPENFKPMASNLKKAIEQKLSFLGDIRVDVVNTLTIPESLGINVQAGSIGT
ncbi:MAG: hypothetical protein KGZ58_06620 [Ignavibacteriales bacterium]|nr:hypothetical protein [Ignavibacteriales bacterium]